MSARNMTITLTAHDDGSLTYTFIDNSGNTKTSSFFVSPDATVGDRIVKRIAYELATSDLIVPQERPDTEAV